MDTSGMIKKQVGKIAFLAYEHLEYLIRLL